MMIFVHPFEFFLHDHIFIFFSSLFLFGRERIDFRSNAPSGLTHRVFIYTWTDWAICLRRSRTRPWYVGWARAGSAWTDLLGVAVVIVWRCSTVVVLVGCSLVYSPNRSVHARHGIVKYSIMKDYMFSGCSPNLKGIAWIRKKLDANEVAI